MKTSNVLKDLFNEITPEERAETKLAFDISNRIYDLMCEQGFTKKQLADALGKRPSEVTKWLSGQHNFTISTLSMLPSFFKQPIVTVG